MKRTHRWSVEGNLFPWGKLKNSEKKKEQLAKNTKVTNVIRRFSIICLSAVVPNKRLNLSKRAIILYGQGLPLTEFSVPDWLGSFILQLWIPLFPLKRFDLFYFWLTSTNKLIAMVLNSLLRSNCWNYLCLLDRTFMSYFSEANFTSLSCNERNGLLLVPRLGSPCD